ncbi:ferritin-like domain-containing protein [Leadbetterella sp. DM7]|uniref:YciE/YciF ferroxidase family protein n=1 Tax=Leadbetterella sp. DM7 TaxID=3235085 RepID=UPI00349E89EE
MKNSDSFSPLSREILENKYKPLFQFFTDGIKDLYWAEKAIETALGKNKQLARTEELSEALEDHEMQTRKHISRLEKVFQALKVEPEAKKCEAMAGILKEAEEIVSKTPEKSMTRDAVLIIAAQKIEHYEIASYGGLVQIALTFNMDAIADILEKTLDEEEETDLLLTDIAESHINLEAAEEEDQDVAGFKETSARSAKSGESSKKTL